MDTLYTARLHGFPNLNKTLMDNAVSEDSILSLLIVLGSSFSLVALVFAFITYSLFSDFRNLSGTTLMNLLASLFMTQVLYVMGAGGVLDAELCIAMAFALQYLRLCIFSWMLIMAYNMHSQFRKDLHLVPVNDTNIEGRYLRYSLFGWGAPSVFLLAGFLLQYHDKAGKLLDVLSLKDQNCWFLDKNAVIYAQALPGCQFACTTFFYLIRCAFLSQYIIGMQPEKRLRAKMRRRRTLQIILFAKINIVLSAVLILSTAAKLFKSEAVWISFHIVQGLQGVMIALLVTCNCQVLKLYAKSLKSSRYFPSYVHSKSNTLNKSTSLQMLTWEPPPDLV